MRHTFFRTLISVVILALLFSGKHIPAAGSTPEEIKWIDSVFNSLTPAERIGQLIMVEVSPGGKDAGDNEILDLIRDYNIGGVVFRQGGPVRQAHMTNRFQSAAITPLMIAMKAGAEPGMEPDSSIFYPNHLTLAAVNDNRLIYEMASGIARQMNRLGVHVNLSPMPGREINLREPLTGIRYHDQYRQTLAEKAGFYRQAMHDNGILTAGAAGSTMPGSTIPGISGRTFSSKLPGKTGSKTGSTEPGTAGLLASALWFADSGFPTGEPGWDGLVRAIFDGSDILLSPAEADKAIIAISRALDDGILNREIIERRCRNVLAAKYRTGLHRYTPVITKNLYSDLNDVNSQLLMRKITAASLTLLENNDDILPLKRLDTLNIATVSVGTGQKSRFQEVLSYYAPMKHYTVNKYSTLEALTRIITDLDQFNLIIIGIDDADVRRSRQYGISPQTSWFIRRLAARNNVVVSLFTSPHGLAFFDDLSNVNALLMAYEDNQLAQEYSAQVIFGGIPVTGRLPVSPLSRYPAGTGHYTHELKRLRYSIPEAAGLDSRKLAEIDELVQNAIDRNATPGAQVLIARRGIVVYHKAFGYHTYTRENPVALTDLYDLASITKIAASVPAIMKLMEEGKLDLYQTLGNYIPRLEGTNKNDIAIKDILTHQAQLQSWIPFVYDAFESLVPGEELFSRRVSARYPYMLGDYMFMNRHYRLSSSQFSNEANDNFNVRIADRMFMNRAYIDSMYRRIDQSPLRNSNRYFYSDLGYYYLKDIIESTGSSPLDFFLEHNLYRSLGANRLTYLPLEKYAPYEIVPTENDAVFRRQLVHGHVHDAGAAMIGGVGSHAGLFSNANDLAKLMQLYLQNGEYGGERYFRPETVQEFTSAPNSHAGNRRGIGFDKPEMSSSRSPAARSASRESYGHSGFTGTMAWVDPREEIVYIFLSNRVHPDQFNNKLTELNLRTKVQQAIYDSIIQ